MADQQDVVSLVDEQGNEVDFTLIDVFDIDNKQYALLEPVEDPESGMVIFAVDKDEKGQEVLRPVEDDTEFEMVKAAIEALWDEEE